MFKTLEELIAVIRQRKDSSVKESYTYKLLKNKKLNLEKIKEEIAELIEAIEKIINSEKLTGTQKEAAKHKLQEKLKILIDGGQKRLNEETVSIYSKKLDELSYLNKL